ncbi:MAG: potassium-transporting ATPase KdpC subunit [Actinomycetota bacterium]|jgi:K+-transporting ATPase ATPase C chain|nr:potassium-transporting ATPase KdpC subunit [Actinomycetota bacterium]
MAMYLRQFWAATRLMLVLTVILGLVYPLSVWAVSRLPGLRANAEGSVVTVSGVAVGSDLIGTDLVPADPNHDPWFHTRPSALAPDPLGPGEPSSSLGSNLAGDSEKLLKLITDRRTAIAAREGVDPSAIPADAVTASGSGLDPAISPAYAHLQVARVARENGLSEQAVRGIVASTVTGRPLGVLGEPTVNVLDLNRAVVAAAPRGR